MAFDRHLNCDPDDLFSLVHLQRQIRGHGYANLGRQIGVSRQFLQRIVSGERAPGERVLAKLGVRRITFYILEKDDLKYQPKPDAACGDQQAE